MFGQKFQLDEHTIPVVEEIGRHMPGGFFIYRAQEPGELLYANHAVIELFGCDDLEDFRRLTGFTFKGMVHPEDYDAILNSIDNQIEASDEKFDAVEYRIIRKDGSVRWLDDYGHFTETEAYGGIYYVFVNDITAKRAQMESDLAVRQAVIEALMESYHTVWLINDVEAETFSLYRGDITGETMHAAPIRDALGNLRYSQAKEYYIKTTVAPGDQERLREILTLDRISDQLRRKPQYAVTYLRMMDDGSERYFRIEFAKVNMPGGKMGIVCGFKDVDDDVRQRAKQDQLITALASDYLSVYHLELDTNSGVCYQARKDKADGLEVGQRFVTDEAFAAYARNYVTDEYREDFLRFVQPDNIRAGLKSNRLISQRYMIRVGDKESYELVRFAGVRHPEDRDDHLVHAVGCCFMDVDDETRASLAQNQALRDALATAEEASKAKTAFLSNMSHEIRTPMNAIIGLDNIALHDPDVPARTRDHLERIGSSAQHLLSLINDILDMSRIESGRMALKSEEFSLSKVLEQVNTIIGGQCHDKGLDYECHIKGHIDDYYIGDDMKLRQVMINILGNAVKFTPSGGRVTFTVEEVARFDGKSTLRLTMTDTGIGMSSEYLPKIFDAFTQEDSSSTNRYGSTGLGMPITKSLVELMNGHIEVESEKGVGTTFVATVTLTDSDRKDNLRDADEGELHPHEIAVLVIDDDPVACEHAQVVLGQVGISCDVAASGAQGIEMVKVRHARRDPYNLILVDWKMPEMDGLETTRQIREVVGHESAIIILTSYNWDDIADEALEVGVDTFVPKPLFVGTVMDEFRDAFKRKGLLGGERKADLTGRHILLAEDMAVNAEIMVMVLSMRDMSVDVAENGQVAVDLFSRSEPGYYAAILMDMRMPVMDGLAATRTIRAMERPDAREIPIIALTANAFDEDVQRSMQAGLNAHLSKPVVPEALYETLESLVK